MYSDVDEKGAARFSLLGCFPHNERLCQRRSLPTQFTVFRQEAWESLGFSLENIDKVELALRLLTVPHRLAEPSSSQWSRWRVLLVRVRCASCPTLFSEKISYCFEQQRFPRREWNWCGAIDPITGEDVNDCMIALQNGSRIYTLG